MFDQAGKNSSSLRSVQATNFQRVLRLIPESTALGIIEPTEVKMSQRAQNLNSFLFEHFQKDLIASTPTLSSLDSSAGGKFLMKNNKSKEVISNNTINNKVKGKGDKPPSSSSLEGQGTVLDQLFGADVLQKNKCTSCGNENVKYNRSNILDLQYLSSENVDHIETVLASPPKLFSHLLRDSISRKKKTRAWCDICKNYNPLLQTKSYTSLPPLLYINSTITEKSHAGKNNLKLFLLTLFNHLKLLLSFNHLKFLLLFNHLKF